MLANAEGALMPLIASYRYTRKDKVFLGVEASDLDLQMLMTYGDGNVVEGLRRILREAGYTVPKSFSEVLHK